MVHPGTKRPMVGQMTGDMLTLVVSLGAGLAFSAALMEAVGMLTYETIGFDLFFRAERQAWRAVPFLLFAGPILLLRLARGVAAEAGWLSLHALAGIVLALFWALASGHLLLSMASFVTLHWPAGALLMGAAG